MGARLVFFRKTQQQFRLQQGDIYFCVNGKCLGKLAATDCFVDLPAGQYQLQMYYSYAYGSMAGIVIFRSFQVLFVSGLPGEMPAYSLVHTMFGLS